MSRIKPTGTGVRLPPAAAVPVTGIADAERENYHAVAPSQRRVSSSCTAGTQKYAERPNSWSENSRSFRLGKARVIAGA